MKGLWKYISPFAPDQSGAAAVLYGLGGIVVVCDAGGCAGNICGFDEPRWFSGGKSAVFSAGLRDMDAILGRDDRLVDKLVQAAETIPASFAAIIGTPVPSVIGTDYRALRRMAEKKLHMPVLTIDTTGMALYDDGIEKAYNQLFRTFADTAEKRHDGTVGVIGAVPLELSRPQEIEDIRQELNEEGWQQVLMYHDLDDYRHAGRASLNLVVSPTGLKSARYLQKTFGTPYKPWYVGLRRYIADDTVFAGRQVLIIHQQTAANGLRSLAEEAGAEQVTVASWFMQPEAYRRPGDIVLKEEDDLQVLADNDRFDVIAGDAYFQKALPHFKGLYIDIPHFAVSGRG
ncbi:nitrogenase component 1 [uncultured Megasphaera sp.]|uniref:nitrogenase component 1 n=1 Tax=uncultured Megasphaera sp. TaxID=165188 RepID=UPI002658D6CB|nr:nitrogenase component 1 [uncultured Megasphaera sp.]